MAEITGETQLVGVFGCPIAHTVSPAMHNAAFAALGLDWCYLPFLVQPERLEAAVRGLPALGIRGVNVTIPHKGAVLPLLDELEEQARLIGAVNTIDQREGKLKGYNTDGEGFLRALRGAGFEPAGCRAVVLGAGGSARAVTAALIQAGAREICLVCRTLSRGEAAARGLRSRGTGSVAVLPWEPASMEAALGQAELLVNATPIGMHPQPEASPVPGSLLRPGLAVFDLVFNPAETRLVREAEKRGARGVGGVVMLVQQGAISFQLWTGRAAPLEIMERAARQALLGPSAEGNFGGKKNC